MFQYIVQPGDYLYGIASNLGVSVDAIMAANPGLSPSNIYPGLIILIPVNYQYPSYPSYNYPPFVVFNFPHRFGHDREMHGERDMDRHMGGRGEDGMRGFAMGPGRRR